MNYHNEHTCFNEITPEFSTDNIFGEITNFQNFLDYLPKTEDIVMSDNYESQDERMSYH